VVIMWLTECPPTRLVETLKWDGGRLSSTLGHFFMAKYSLIHEATQ
jgi:hypothetical protein